MFDEVEVGDPIFTASEVAKVFYARSIQWIHRAERKVRSAGMEPAGSRNPSGHRRYSLVQIQEQADQFLQADVISQAQRLQARDALHVLGRIYGYLS